MFGELHPHNGSLKAVFFAFLILPSMASERTFTTRAELNKIFTWAPREPGQILGRESPIN